MIYLNNLLKVATQAVSKENATGGLNKSPTRNMLGKTTRSSRPRLSSIESTSHSIERHVKVNLNPEHQIVDEENDWQL